MKAATIKQLKDELSERPPKEVLEYCLRLAKFKLDCKELLTYLLFEADDEAGFVIEYQKEMDSAFEAVNRKNYSLIKRGIQKILRTTKKQIRFSKVKETEVELIMHFLKNMNQFTPSIRRNRVLRNSFERQVIFVNKKISALHEDLQFDYNLEMDGIINSYHSAP